MRDTATLPATLTALASRLGGYPEALATTPAGEGLGPRVSATLRVPEPRLTDALAELRALADRVEYERLGARDVTRQHVDLEARLGNLERAETQLRQMLERADDAPDDVDRLMSIFRELTQVREQIERHRAELGQLDELVQMATIDVEAGPLDAGPPLVDAEWSFGATVRSAARGLTESLQWLATGLIYLFVTVLPVALLVAVPAWVIAVIFRRFRRGGWIAGQGR